MTQFNGPSLYNLCALKGRHWVLTGVLREILIWHFASGASAQEPNLRELLWKPGKLTNILIESAHRWVPETSMLRPAVIVKRNSYAGVRLGIGDRRQMNPMNKHGDPQFSQLRVGSHTCFCLGGSGAQAEYLASEVEHLLGGFGHLIQQWLGLKRFRVMEIGPVDELEEAQENFVVPVNIGIAYEQSWTIMQQAPPLRKLSLSLIAEA